MGVLSLPCLADRDAVVPPKLQRYPKTHGCSPRVVHLKFRFRSKPPPITRFRMVSTGPDNPNDLIETEQYRTTSYDFSGLCARDFVNSGDNSSVSGIEAAQSQVIRDLESNETHPSHNKFIHRPGWKLATPPDSTATVSNTKIDREKANRRMESTKKVVLSWLWKQKKCHCELDNDPENGIDKGLENWQHGHNNTQVDISPPNGSTRRRKQFQNKPQEIQRHKDENFLPNSLLSNGRQCWARGKTLTGRFKRRVLKQIPSARGHRTLSGPPRTMRLLWKETATTTSSLPQTPATNNENEGGWTEAPFMLEVVNSSVSPGSDQHARYSLFPISKSNSVSTRLNPCPSCERNIGEAIEYPPPPSSGDIENLPATLRHPRVAELPTDHFSPARYLPASAPHTPTEALEAKLNEGLYSLQRMSASLISVPELPQSTLPGPEDLSFSPIHRRHAQKSANLSIGLGTELNDPTSNPDIPITPENISGTQNLMCPAAGRSTPKPHEFPQPPTFKNRRQPSPTRVTVSKPRSRYSMLPEFSILAKQQIEDIREEQEPRESGHWGLAVTNLDRQNSMLVTRESDRSRQLSPSPSITSLIIPTNSVVNHKLGRASSFPHPSRSDKGKNKRHEMHASMTTQPSVAKYGDHGGDGIEKENQESTAAPTFTAKKKEDEIDDLIGLYAKQLRNGKINRGSTISHRNSGLSLTDPTTLRHRGSRGKETRLLIEDGRQNQAYDDRHHLSLTHQIPERRQRHSSPTIFGGSGIGISLGLGAGTPPSVSLSCSSNPGPQITATAKTSRRSPSSTIKQPSSAMWFSGSQIPEEIDDSFQAPMPAPVPASVPASAQSMGKEKIASSSYTTQPSCPILPPHRSSLQVQAPSRRRNNDFSSTNLSNASANVRDEDNSHRWVHRASRVSGGNNRSRSGSGGIGVGIGVVAGQRITWIVQQNQQQQQQTQQHQRQTQLTNWRPVSSRRISTASGTGTGRSRRRTTRRIVIVEDDEDDDDDNDNEDDGRGEEDERGGQLVEEFEHEDSREGEAVDVHNHHHSRIDRAERLSMIDLEMLQIMADRRARNEGRGWREREPGWEREQEQEQEQDWQSETEIDSELETQDRDEEEENGEAGWI